MPNQQSIWISAPAIPLCVLLCAITAGTHAATANLDAGLTAYRQGNYEAAMEQWLPIARSGDQHAQLFVAFMYRRGKGVVPDLESAVKWYRAAAEQGNPNAQYELGLMHELGIGTDINHEDAVYWYGMAEDQGFCPGELQAGGILGEE